MPASAIYVGRPTKFGNRFTKDSAGCGCHICLTYQFENELQHRGKPEVLVELRGKDLACWCSEKLNCHADILLVAANWSDAPGKWKTTFANLRPLGEAVDRLTEFADTARYVKRELDNKLEFRDQYARARPREAQQMTAHGAPSDEQE